MKRIKCITDLTLGIDNLYSRSHPRRTARAIIENSNGNIALLHTDEYSLYSLPGGGIEPGEDIHSALTREIVEETGCNIVSIRELGYIEENRGYCDYTQISYFFLVKTDSIEFHPRLTVTEKKYGTTVDWYTKEEVKRLLSDKDIKSDLTKEQTNQIKFLKARDLAAFTEYLNHHKKI